MPDENNATINSAKSMGDLGALLKKIYEARGYDFREYKTASVERRIKKRLFEHHLETYEQYSALLDSDPEEYSKLFDTLLINVSEFFRDPDAWDIIANEIIPDILAKKKEGDAIRIWSAGCSSGEEPYSLAVLMSEKLGDAITDYNVRIYATDIDDKALGEARRGVFPQDKLKNVREDLLNKYFIRENSFYKVQRNIRQMVTFGLLDLASDAPISHVDMIICRNVLIYFKVDLQNRVVTKFHYAINKNGYIFFGKSESMLVGSNLFEPINKKWRIFEKIDGQSPSAQFNEKRPVYRQEQLKKD
jgi:two-component system CheB/CheR fusion protein